MTEHYRQHRATLAFERNAGKLRIELALGSERRHLDTLLELLRTLVEYTGGSVATTMMRAELAELERAVAGRSHLQVVR